jgi:hypothetical protein
MKVSLYVLLVQEELTQVLLANLCAQSVSLESFVTVSECKLKILVLLVITVLLMPISSTEKFSMKPIDAQLVPFILELML